MLLDCLELIHETFLSIGLSIKSIEIN